MDKPSSPIVEPTQEKLDESAVARHHSSMHSVNKVLAVERQQSDLKKKGSDDLGDTDKFFDVSNPSQIESMSVHDCKPGQNDKDENSQYTYVSVSDMSHTQGAANSNGNSVGMLSPHEKPPI